LWKEVFWEVQNQESEGKKKERPKRKNVKNKISFSERFFLEQIFSVESGGRLLGREGGGGGEDAEENGQQSSVEKEFEELRGKTDIVQEGGGELVRSGHVEG